MRTVDQLINAIQSIDKGFLYSNAILESGTDYVKIQQQQMMKGEREDGKPIFNVISGKDTYSPSYAKKKGKFKPIDLYDTGAFQSGIFLHIDDATDFVVDSADSKSGMLQNNYGTQIFGLNDENKVQFKPVAQKNLVTDLINELAK